MPYNYQLVGGSAPCFLNLDEETKELINLFPNLVVSGDFVH